MNGKESAVPNHIGFVLDGNRRWAREHNLPVVEGHRIGYMTLKEVGSACLAHGIKYLTAYIFSTENWKRDEKEVNFLMKLFLMAARKDITFAQEENIRIRFLAHRESLKPELVSVIEQLEDATKNNTRGTLSLCLNYGGQQEIADAARQCLEDGLTADQLTPAAIESQLYSPDIPPVDLIVRTSGEKRLSNFMLWRSAYSELLFMEKHWPEMTKADVDVIIEEYNRRSRRFGG